MSENQLSLRADTGRVINSLEAGEVLRFHAEPHIPCQTVGLHSWGVAVIAAYIVPPGIIRPNLLLAALRHDTGERYTGDIPFTAKRGCFREIRKKLDEAEELMMHEHVFPMPKLEPFEEIILKLCDMLEGLRYSTTYEPHFRTQVSDRWFFSIQEYIVCEEVANAMAEPWQRALLDRALKLLKAIAGNNHSARVEDSWEVHRQRYGKNRAIHEREEIEALAKEIYERWMEDPEFKPWTPYGNSDKQNEARAQAKARLNSGASGPPAVGVGGW